MTELHSHDNAAVATDSKPEVSSTEEFRVSVCSDANTSSSTVDTDKFHGFDSKSLLPEFDEYVAAERHVSQDLGFEFEVGDMVWGKVKSHPWWLRHVYNEAFNACLCSYYLITPKKKKLVGFFIFILDGFKLNHL